MDIVYNLTENRMMSRSQQRLMPQTLKRDPQTMWEGPGKRNYFQSSSNSMPGSVDTNFTPWSRRSNMQRLTPPQQFRNNNGWSNNGRQQQQRSMSTPQQSHIKQSLLWQQQQQQQPCELEDKEIF